MEKDKILTFTRIFSIVSLVMGVTLYSLHFFVNAFQNDLILTISYALVNMAIYIFMVCTAFYLISQHSNTPKAKERY